MANKKKCLVCLIETRPTQKYTISYAERIFMCMYGILYYMEGMRRGGKKF